MQKNHPETEKRASTPPHVSRVLDRNISALLKRQAEDDRNMKLEERIAAGITAFAGSMLFVYIHAGVFGLWILINIGWLPILPKWDESLVILAMAASVEAIFLSTFVLISQNRMAAKDDKRADLSLQISLLNEHETARLIAMVDAMADHLGVTTGISKAEIEEMKQHVPPEQVLEALEQKNGTSPEQASSS